MAVGSAFDAFIKSHLYETLHGGCPDPRFSFAALFEKQVEPQNRDAARKDGWSVFCAYRRSGAIADLMLELGKAVGPVIFEIELKGSVGSVPLLGRPDVFFVNELGTRIVYDWKVNGFYSNASPTKGYIRRRPGNGMHKDCTPVMFGGLMVNGACWFEDISADWARQLSTYAWLVGESVGSEGWIIGIDQIAFRGGDASCVSHRGRVSRGFQDALWSDYKLLWEIIESGYIFRDRSEDASRELCSQLDVGIKSDGSAADEWFKTAARGG